MSEWYAPADTLDTVRRNGLILRRPDGDQQVVLRVAASVDEVDVQDDDVIIIAVKSQDTSSVLLQLARTAPPTVHVVCAQNGVGNEPEELRWFENVYGVMRHQRRCHSNTDLAPAPGTTMDQRPSGSRRCDRDGGRLVFHQRMTSH